MLFYLKAYNTRKYESFEQLIKFAYVLWKRHANFNYVTYFQVVYRCQQTLIHYILELLYLIEMEKDI